MNTAAVVPFYFQSNEVRTITIEGQPWFVAADVCAALGLENPTMALKKVPEKHTALNRIEGRGEQAREVNTVSEPGLYRLILRSDKPQAEPFMEWITGEVLPTIRKTGQYSFSDDGEFYAPAAVSIPRLEEAARGVKAAMIMARAYGWRNEDARQYANNVVKDITGIDTLALLNIPVAHETPAAQVGTFREEVARIVGEYIAERCDLEATGLVSATTLYADFAAWYQQHYSGQTPSHSIFGSIMATYRPKWKKSGFVYYRGVALRAVEVAQ